MEETNKDNKKLYIRPEDVLEFLYEISDNWKEATNPIDKMKDDLRTMIRYFKEEKFNKLKTELNLDS